MSERADVVVIGGGPAGCTAAALIAGAGRRVVLLEREAAPRFRIGESLMPATYWTLERLGMLEAMRESAFPKKYSVQFFGASGRSSVPFYFHEVDSHESSQTWQVDRAVFDRMLLDRAREAGAEVRERANVREVVFDAERADGVRYEDEAGGPRVVSARVVVDASGQTGLIARQLGLREFDPELRHASFFTRYRGAKRDPGIDEGATLVLKTEHDRCWFWYIPLPDDTVSVGVVGSIDHLLKGREGTPQQVYDAEVAACPALIERITGARQVMDVVVMRDFSYISRRIAGPGWVLAGDAFGFLDPIYSTGVMLALVSGEMAADAVAAAFESGDFSAATLGRHGERYLAGMEAMRKLVYAFYDPAFSFARFLERHPEHRGAIVDLLVGNVFRKPVGSLFEAMAGVCALPAARGHVPDERRG